MAEAVAFQFQPGRSILHRFDPRFKTVGLLVLSPCILMARPVGLAGLSICLLGLVLWSGLNWRSAIYDLRYFGLVLAAVFLSRAIFTPGQSIFSMGDVRVTVPGLLAGGLYCWRLILVTIIGLMYAATTRSREIRAAITWIMAGIPGVPEKRVGTMVGLLVRMLPMVLDQVRQTQTAQRARCAECRKNPYTRLIRLAIPTLRRIFRQADHLAVAMAARCYQEAATPPAMAIRTLDRWGMGSLVGLCLLLIGSTFWV